MVSGDFSRIIGIQSSKFPAKSQIAAGCGVTPFPGNTVSRISIGVVHTIKPTPKGERPSFKPEGSSECNADSTNERSLVKVSGS